MIILYLVLTGWIQIEGCDMEKVQVGWTWCLRCERCYVLGEFRMVRGLRLCPYPDCDGDQVLDGFSWLDYRYGKGVEVKNPEWPVRDKVYPLSLRPVSARGFGRVGWRRPWIGSTLR
jgi:hypothetical protein